MAPSEPEMREAAEAAAALIEPGMRVGLGTGRTVAWLLQALAARNVGDLRCVATSPDTERAATALGIPVEPFDRLARLDVAIDGADQVTDDHWAIKGGHGAHLREKIVAAAAERFVVIVSRDKLVDALHPPVPLELERFGLAATLSALGQAALRPGAPVTPDGGVLADYHGPIEDREALARRFDQTPGVTGHGLFGPPLIHDVIVGGDRRAVRSGHEFPCSDPTRE
ncbi:MAG TPA: ribose 5-phosphate isomerase A [Solirubrobacteraceae bacterium]|jgi:ribose 5-phosphate isomerase A|nr:ribose 5-phosphate isomerase A [Solirubrobacteraceae bacterium]